MSEVELGEKIRRTYPGPASGPDLRLDHVLAEEGRNGFQLLDTTPVSILDWATAKGFLLTAAALARIDLPVLVVRGGARHPAVRRANALTAELVKGASLGTIDRAAHFMVATHADQAGRMLAAHVRGGGLGVASAVDHSSPRCAQRDSAASGHLARRMGGGYGLLSRSVLPTVSWRLGRAMIEVLQRKLGIVGGSPPRGNAWAQPMRLPAGRAKPLSLRARSSIVAELPHGIDRSAGRVRG